MGEVKRIRKDEVAALRLGIGLGLTHIDTAEMYADGQAEEIVAEAVGGQRDREIEKDVVPHCERERIAVVGYTPLARGGFMRGVVADVPSGSAGHRARSRSTSSPAARRSSPSRRRRAPSTPAKTWARSISRSPLRISRP